MLRLLSALSLLIAFSQPALAQQGSLNLAHGDDVVLAANPGDVNVKQVDPGKLPAKILNVIGNIDIPFEMGDGYYSTMANATYQVTNSSGAVVGYLEVSLLSYTEDPDVYLVAAAVNSRGKRLSNSEGEELYVLNQYNNDKDPEIGNLPPELQPQDDQD